MRYKFTIEAYNRTSICQRKINTITVVVKAINNYLALSTAEGLAVRAHYQIIKIEEL